MEREIRAVGIMIDIFCRRCHGTDERCPDCGELFDYARQRSVKCPFGVDKPVCGRCPVHCYKPRMKDKIREVMKFSGPRMIFFHPVLAAWHMIEARKNPPSIPPAKKPSGDE